MNTTLAIYCIFALGLILFVVMWRYRQITMMLQQSRVNNTEMIKATRVAQAEKSTCDTRLRVLVGALTVYQSAELAYNTPALKRLKLTNPKRVEAKKSYDAACDQLATVQDLVETYLSEVDDR